MYQDPEVRNPRHLEGWAVVWKGSSVQVRGYQIVDLERSVSPIYKELIVPVTEFKV